MSIGPAIIKMGRHTHYRAVPEIGVDAETAIDWYVKKYQEDKLSSAETQQLVQFFEPLLDTMGELLNDFRIDRKESFDVIITLLASGRKEWIKSSSESKIRYVREYYQKEGIDEIRFDLTLSFLDFAKKYCWEQVSFYRKVYLHFGVYLGRQIAKKLSDIIHESMAILPVIEQEEKLTTRFDNESETLVFALLTQKQRQVLRMYYQDGYNDRQIAQKMSQHINTVNAFRRKVLEFLEQTTGRAIVQRHRVTGRLHAA